jgi:type IV secretory pathway TrbF-like protein/predicted MFS family arabinose efflux permease
VRHRRMIILVFLPFVAGFYLSYLFRTINALIADKLASDLALTPADLGLLTSVYFLSFAAIQLPLGVWLDRCGPRQVQSILLVIATLGTVLFGLAERLATLVVGRALIGLGLAGALVAGVKAIVLWFPKEQVALLNGWFLTIGALGAVTATVPAEWLLPLIGWRGLFLLLAPVTALCALAIFLAVPECHAAPGAQTRSTAFDLRAIYSDFRFWRLAPLSATCIGTAWALPGLWAGSWLTDVEGLERPAVVGLLCVMALALCVAALGLGVAADRLRRRGVCTQTLFAGTAGLFIAAQLALVEHWPLPSYLLWSIVAGTGAATVLAYAMLAEYFPKEATGRANGALNTLHFGFAFITQWMIGLILQQWASQSGHYPATAYRIALGLNLAPQVAAFVWFVRPWHFIPRPMPAQTVRQVSSSRLSRMSSAMIALWVRTLDSALQLVARFWFARREPPRLPPLRVLRDACASDRLRSPADPKVSRILRSRPGHTLPQSVGWRVAAAGSAFLCALLSVSLGVVASRAGTVGHRERVPIGNHTGVNLLDAQIIYFLSRFIENARSLSTDPIVVHTSWRDAYAYVTDSGVATLTEYGRQTDPFTLAGMRAVSVEILSAERLSKDSFLVRWAERSFENGLRLSAEHFTGVFEIVFCRPGSPEALIANPLGLYIRAIDWSSKLGQRDRQGSDRSPGPKHRQSCA